MFDPSVLSFCLTMPYPEPGIFCFKMFCFVSTTYRLVPSLHVLCPLSSWNPSWVDLIGICQGWSTCTKHGRDANQNWDKTQSSRVFLNLWILKQVNNKHNCHVWNDNLFRKMYCFLWPLHHNVICLESVLQALLGWTSKNLVHPSGAWKIEPKQMMMASSHDGKVPFVTEVP